MILCAVGTVAEKALKAAGLRMKRLAQLMLPVISLPVNQQKSIQVKPMRSSASKVKSVTIVARAVAFVNRTFVCPQPSICVICLQRYLANAKMCVCLRWIPPAKR